MCLTIKTTPQELFIACIKLYLGTDASPNDNASDEFGCAESVSNILHSIFKDFPAGILSTAELFQALKASKRFKGVLYPQEGCVIVSPRTKDKNGHTGFIIEKNYIISNDSKTGLMKQNYTLLSWEKEFKDKRGLKTHLFSLV